MNAKLSAAVRIVDAGFATIFGCNVEDPERFGSMGFKKVSDNRDSGLSVVSVEEKPANPKSNYAIVGMYFYPAEVGEMAENMKPSPRGELEMAKLNDIYLKECRMNV